ncbi:MAG: Rieske 2Fe-2S domain-containing protein, partial [Gammaproteobacteria bacterium]|nr:Rieske 2Fe-2S domain-containing protein [Gammaproteobacteria bacterium]
MEQIICRLEEITEHGGISFNYTQCGESREGFVLVYQGQVRAYVNSCPHTGVTLNWSENQFFDYSQQFIQCSVHGAIFQPLTGACVRGPCLGQNLSPLEVKLDDQQLV